MRILFCFFFVMCSLVQAQAQSSASDKVAVADSILSKRGEIVFSFTLPDQINIQDVSQIISIDRVQGKNIRAYANRKEFNRFLLLKIDFEIIQPITSQSFLKAVQTTTGAWYPTYGQYDSIMHKFQTDYPSLCQLTEIGKSVEGRSLYFLKISQNVQQHLSKPVVMYSSSMHGDEIVGYALMLRLIDYMLTNYTQPQVQTLIDSCELWICPLANPDGTYFGGNQTVFGSKRYNGNNVDLNRNFPDPAAGNHPDGNAWQPENIAVMDFLKQHPLTLSANFHSGSEVVNYPWDTWAKLHADDVWYQLISAQYADTVQHYGPNGFYTDVNATGITNGYKWYTITGGRQDYVNYFMHGREVTIEMDEVKLEPETNLDKYWNYHYRALLNYLYQSNYGIRGRITDKNTGNAIKATLEIPGHDFDESYIYSDSTTGMYYRMLAPGTYNLQVSATGYVSQTVTGVQLNAGSKVRIDFQLQTPDTTHKTFKEELVVFPNPATNLLTLQSDYFDGSSKVSVIVSDLIGRRVKSMTYENPVSDIYIDVSDLRADTYFIQINSTSLNKTVKFVKL